MPIKVFKCKKCGYIFEQFIQSSKGKKLQCPQCDSDKTEQTFLGQFLWKLGCAENG